MATFIFLLDLPFQVPLYIIITSGYHRPTWLATPPPLLSSPTPYLVRGAGEDLNLLKLSKEDK